MPLQDKEGQTAAPPVGEGAEGPTQEAPPGEQETRLEEQSEGGATGEAESPAPERPAVPEEEAAGAYRERIASLEREVADYVRHLQRLQADFENFRKRVRREQEELRERVTEDLLRRLLPVVDNLERAVAAAELDGASLENLQAGVTMVYRQLAEFLLKEGASPLVARGETFDPTKHHAVATVESEEHAENTVVDELQKGYLFHGRLLRPALVRVAKRPAAEKVIPLRPEEGECDG